MSFIADKQTIEDLNILGKYKPNSIFSVFDRVQTQGGEKLLEQLFLHPLVDEKLINQRSNIFKYFQNKGFSFPLYRTHTDIMENYLSGSSGQYLVSTGITHLRKKALGVMINDEAYTKLQKGIQTTMDVLNACFEFFSKLSDYEDGPYETKIQFVNRLSNDSRLAKLNGLMDDQQLSIIASIRYDHLLRHTLRKELFELMEIISYLDVYIAVGRVAMERGFCYANALPKDINSFNAVALKHPGLDKAVGNSISFHHKSNLMFLTGANMAGKSTLMKALGISMYLAHMGFPIAAKAMNFSVKDGLYSSINVADNLNRGYSHFYAEVLRVKKVAEEVSSSKHLMVIFDELFKGTNVKDAYDATLAVTEAFSAYRACSFIISTHIIEVGHALQQHGNHIQFVFLPTIMEGIIPRYSYQLEKGITTDRQGMVIIENEGIFRILHEEEKTATS